MAGEFCRFYQCPPSVLPSLFTLGQSTMTEVLISSQNSDVPIHPGNLLKGFINIVHDEEAEKYRCDGRVKFYLMYGELRHHIMTLERGQQHCGALVHSGRHQLVPPQNPILIQAAKNLPRLVI